MLYYVEYKGQSVPVSREVINVLFGRLKTRRKINRDILYYSNYDLVECVDRNFSYDSYENSDLKHALSSLSSDEFTLVNLLYYHGYSQKQVGAYLNLSQAAVSRRLNKILAKLKHLLLEVI